MQGVRHRPNHITQELGGRHLVGRGIQFGECELGGAVDSHKEMELALSGLHFSNVDKKVAKGELLKRCLTGLSPSISGRREMS